MAYSYGNQDPRNNRSRSVSSAPLVHSNVKSNNLIDDEFDEKELNFKFLEEDSLKLKQLKVIQLQIYFWRQRGINMPANLLEKHWFKLLNMNDEIKLKYLNYLWMQENRKKRRKEIQAAELEKFERYKAAESKPAEISTNGPLIYSLTYNALFHRIYDVQIENFYDYKLLQAASFGTPILVDCGFESNTIFLVKQLEMIFKNNRQRVCPYNLIFCNLDDNSSLMEGLRKQWKTLNDPCHPFEYTGKNYTDIHPKEKLVYIIPSAVDSIGSYNPDDVYIIRKFEITKT